jgi:hypothetical protein
MRAPSAADCQNGSSSVAGCFGRNVAAAVIRRRLTGVPAACTRHSPRSVK